MLFADNCVKPENKLNATGNRNCGTKVTIKKQEVSVTIHILIYRQDGGSLPVTRQQTLFWRYFFQLP